MKERRALRLAIVKDNWRTILEMRWRSLTVLEVRWRSLEWGRGI